MGRPATSTAADWNGSPRDGVTTFKHTRGKTWRFDFRWTPPGETRSRRYTGTTGQLTKEAADRFEAKEKERVRLEWAGLAPMDRSRSMHLQVFAAHHLKHVVERGRLKRPEVLKQTLRLCMQFFGRRPEALADPAAAPSQWRQRVASARARADRAPYHDLKLIDPVLEPEWIVKFERWMTDLGLSGARKNHYRSAMSGIYRTAMLPQFRKACGITMNPFLNLERDRVRARHAVLSPVQLLAWLTAAAPHVRVAMALAVYAPELRRGAILGLKWGEHIDAAITKITTAHKTDRWTGRPQVIPISSDLAAILRGVRAAQPGAKYVVAVRDRTGKWTGVTRIETAMRNATRRANELTDAAGQPVLAEDQRLTYGVRGDGVTFHSIRHTMATWLAEWGLTPAVRQLLMGHLSYATTEKYTHLAATAKRDPLARIMSEVNLVSVVLDGVQKEAAKARKKPKVSAAARMASNQQ